MLQTMKLKQLLATVFFIVLVYSASFSQVNAYFLNNPVWLASSSCAVPAPCIQNESYNYYVNGDTILNSLVYKKIFMQGQGTYNWMAPPPNNGCSGSYTYINTVPSYFLRSAGKKMFLRQPSDTAEYLLYDFNLNVGDTLPLSYNNYANNVIVTAKDSIYTPYGYRMRFTLSNSWSQYLLEGIGHSKGLVEPLNVPLECGYNLNCFSLNDTAYFPAIGPGCLLLGIVSLPGKIPISVFPNPFNDFTTIQLNSFEDNAEINIYNLYGQKTRTIKNIYGDKIIIERGSLAAGLYYFELRMNNGNSSAGKLMITE
jgi:hypothetical protein